jgi:16S rRNA (adenine1518-N6/adenine1519-N6)-dimethyltransferase
VTVVPKKALGQHFLVDENILGVIGRLAELQPEDVVLEIGPGLGVLTAYLADRVARVHAVELDRSLEPQLAERLGGRDNVAPRSSSRTCRTTSRRRSSWKASTASPRSPTGA